MVYEDFSEQNPSTPTHPLPWCLNATLVPWLLNFPGYKKVIEVISNRVCGNKQRAPLRHKLRGPQVILNPWRSSLRCRPGWGQVLDYCCTVTTRLPHNERAWAQELKRLVCNEHRALLQHDTWLRRRTDCTRLLPLHNLVLSHQDLGVKWFYVICLNKNGRIPFNGNDFVSKDNALSLDEVPLGFLLLLPVDHSLPGESK